jgi:pimeloyl-ACP methyl ester carboxylesterase
MIHRRHIHLDGIDLSYLEQGTPASNQPSLILLHGLMGCADTMRLLMAELSPDIHIIALDFPGAGGSERRPDIDPTLTATALLTAHFLQALNLHQPCLMGHSHGGAVALQLVATDPTLIRSLALIAPAHPYFDEGDPLIRFYLSLPGRIFAYTLPWYPRWMQMIGLRRMAGPHSWDTLEKLQPYRDNLQTTGTMSHLLRLLTTWHQDMAALHDLLRNTIATPTLLIWGDSDPAVPPLSVHELRARLRYSELHILKGVGHRPAEERPRETAALIEEWLRRPLSRVASYKPNSSVSQQRIAAPISPSLGVGDAGRPLKK